MAWPKIFLWLRENAPDAIILHTISALFPCKLYSALQGIPLIVVEHQPNALKRPSEWMFSHLAMYLASNIVVLTADYMGELRDKLGSKYVSEKVSIIPNGINTSKFRPKKILAQNTGKVIVGMAARFTATKRQDVLIEAIKELKSRCPNTDWRLTLAGDGETLSSIKKKVRSLGLYDSIEFAGNLGEDALCHWFSELDFYLQASEGETLSTAILQAMSCGKPIVASDVPGIRNLLCSQNNCGITVAGQEGSGFAEAIIKLTNNPGLSCAIGKSGRRVVEEKYSQQQMFVKYKELL
jgi:glycosyltransferase involved in cell wall biosynthesis